MVVVELVLNYDESMSIIVDQEMVINRLIGELRSSKTIIHEQN